MSRNDTTMNCNDYRQAVSADPSDAADEVRRHAAECADCRAFHGRLQVLDGKLARAMAIPVPALKMPALPDVAPGGDNVVELHKRRLTVPAWFGIAAGFALAAYFGLLMLPAGRPELTLAEEVVAHMDHEAGSRIVSNVAVPERTLESVVSRDVAEMDPGIGLITYARSCVINGNLIPHLVIQGENGPITLLLLPDERIENAVPLHGQNIDGIILPLGEGSIAIVGPRGEPMQEIGKRVVDSVRWST